MLKNTSQWTSSANRSRMSPLSMTLSHRPPSSFLQEGCNQIDVPLECVRTHSASVIEMYVVTKKILKFFRLATKFRAEVYLKLQIAQEIANHCASRRNIIQGSGGDKRPTNNVRSPRVE